MKKIVCNLQSELVKTHQHQYNSLSSGSNRINTLKKMYTAHIQQRRIAIRESFYDDKIV